jgi:hypothetical protein
MYSNVLILVEKKNYNSNVFVLLNMQVLRICTQ